MARGGHGSGVALRRLLFQSAFLALLGCHHRVQCTIDGAAVPAGMVDPSNQCRACQPDASTSEWTPLPGVSCGAASVCWEDATCRVGCFIDGIVVAPGTRSPTNPCLTCQPALDLTGWTAATGPAGGVGCDGGVCFQGLCVSECAIDGTIYPNGSPDPGNPCRGCQPSVDPEAWTALPGASCAGGVCMSGVCQQGCYVGGTLYPQGSVDPGNVCLGCDPSLSSSEFLPLPSGTPCSDAGAVCVAGSCRQTCTLGGTSFPIGSASPVDSCLSCQGGATGVDWAVFDGVAVGLCDGGQVCDHGSCKIGCGINGQYWPPRAYEPGGAGAPTFCCNPSSDPRTWTPGFQQGATYSARVGGIDASEIVAADFDQDGIGDLATLNWTLSAGGFVGVYLGLGAGQFGPPTAYATGDSPSGLAVGDLNGDGFPDLVFRDVLGVGVLVNNGAGSGFRAESVLGVTGASNPGALPIALGDLDGDGRLDILTAEDPGQLSTFLNDGDGGFGAEVLSSLNVPASRGHHLDPLLGDFSGNGVLDLALLVDPGSLIAANLGSGSFGNPVDILAFCVGNNIWAGPRITGGPAILASGCYSSSALTVFVDPAHSGLSGQASYAVPESVAIRGGDINGDGWVDLVSLGSDPGSGTAIVSLLLALPDGGFLPASATTVDPGALWNWGPLAVGDLHGGAGQAPDVAVLNQGKTFTVWLNGCP